MKEWGYVFRVYSTDWFEMCPDRSTSAACHRYGATDLTAVHDLPLRVSEKAGLVVGAYLSRSKLRARAYDLYSIGQGWLARVGIQLPGTDWSYRLWSYQMNTVNTLRVAKRLVRDLSTASRGDFFFAHLLAPHDPFVYDSNCTLLPMDQWVTRGLVVSRNPEDDRRAREAAYGRQVRCTMTIISRILEAIPEALRSDATFVVHGDHGSRFSMDDDRAGRPGPVSAAEFADKYSTLFAVRSPGIDAGVENRVAPITCVLKGLVETVFHSVGDLSTCTTPAVVFSHDSRGRSVASALPNPPFTNR